MEIIILTGEEVARTLKISREQAYDRLERGEIPAYRDGRSWKIPKRLLTEYVESKALREAKERKEVQEMYREEKEI